MLVGQTERVFPIAILGLFGSGAYMTSKVWTVPRVAAQAIPEP